MKFADFQFDRLKMRILEIWKQRERAFRVLRVVHHKNNNRIMTICYTGVVGLAFVLALINNNDVSASVAPRDKLDYLNRDAFFCGVPYGLQDTEYVLNSLLPSKEKGIEILSKNIMSVENILFSKYLMYKSVYWHKTVRIATGMMKKFLFEAVSSGEITFPRLYSMDDNEIKNFVIESKEEYASIGKDLFSGNIYPVVYEKKVLSPLKIENLEERKKVETELALKLRAKGFDCNYNDIIIDIPENISFEADLYVKDEGCFFPESSTVFTKEIIKEFTNSLRKVRIAVKNGHNIPDEIFFSIAQEVKLD